MTAVHLRTIAHSFLSVKPHPANSQVQPRGGVPADSIPYHPRYQLLRGTTVRGPHPSAGTPPLQVLVGSALVLKRWGELYPLLLALTGSPQRAEMAREALRLQALCGRCFAGARYLAAAGLGDEKTWDRCLRRLRERRLVQTARLYRPNGQRSTNLLDLRSLWRLLRGLLERGRIQLERVRGYWWVKVMGAWQPLAEMLGEGPANAGP